MTAAMPANLKLWAETHQARLWLSARIVVACVVTFTVAHLLGWAQSYWAVLSSVIVMQSSVGGSIKATVDRLVGSLGGAVWGVVVCLGVPHHDVLTLGVALGVAVAPLAVATAFNPAWRVAPVTALILLLTPTSQAIGPVAAAIQRMLEVGLGSIVAVAVALLLAPTRSHADLTGAAKTALETMAQLMTALMAGLTRERDPHAVEGLHDAIRAAIARGETAADEARRERLVTMTAAADPAPLCRTLRRVHHDLIMVGRVSLTPWPAPVEARLAAPVAAVAQTVTRFLLAMATAIGRHAAPPPVIDEEGALAEFSDAVATLRGSGVAGDLPDDVLARLFGLSFALEQLRKDLGDLAERGAEFAEPTR